jgi:hypothetical protein
VYSIASFPRAEGLRSRVDLRAGCIFGTDQRCFCLDRFLAADERKRRDRLFVRRERLFAAEEWKGKM